MTDEETTTTYPEVPGWFGFAAYSDMVVQLAPPGSTLVELGVFCGKSLVYLGQKAKVANKGLKVVGVDTFRGSPEFKGRVFFDNRPLRECHPGSIVREAFGALSNADLDYRDVQLIISDSSAAADFFRDESVYSVFIDADHSEAAVRCDIEAWAPKIVPGGWMGGDDIHIFPGVMAAVSDLLPQARIEAERCWWETQKVLNG